MGKRARVGEERPISSFFRRVAPLEPGVVEMVVDLAQDDVGGVVDLTAERIAVDVVNLVETTGGRTGEGVGKREGEPLKKKLHSFFDLCATKQANCPVESSASRTIRRISRPSAPPFPALIGNPPMYVGTLAQQCVPPFEPKKRLEKDWNGYGCSVLKSEYCPLSEYCGRFVSSGDRSLTADFSGADAVLDDIVKQATSHKGKEQKYHWVDEDDDDWLPTSFRSLKTSTRSNTDGRNIHLIIGPPRTGKSALASRLTQAMAVKEVVELNAGTVRTGKPLEDLLTSSRHHSLHHHDDSSSFVVVLVDEIDLLFHPSDASFPRSLSAYLAQAPPNHIVLMTSNSSLSLLRQFYLFPPDTHLHTITRKDYVPSLHNDQNPLCIEEASYWDWVGGGRRQLEYAGPAPLITSTADYQPSSLCTSTEHPEHLSTLLRAYAAQAVTLKLSPPPPSLHPWTLLSLPTWSALQKSHSAAEEERLLSRRRIRQRAGPSKPYILGIPDHLLALLPSWPS